MPSSRATPSSLTHPQIPHTKLFVFGTILAVTQIISREIGSFVGSLLAERPDGPQQLQLQPGITGLSSTAASLPSHWFVS